jgi:hypothetical protein
MGFTSLNDASTMIHEQLNAILSQCNLLLGNDLIGVYLHGSLAMDCFNESRSDMDLLAVTKGLISSETQKSFTEFFSDREINSIPVEISFLNQKDLLPWQYPTPYHYHYSEEVYENLRQQLQNGEWTRWSIVTRKDEDLAVHITYARQRGICLYGLDPEEVFPEVPRADFVASILQDTLGLEFGLNPQTDRPVYMLLNACRTLEFLQEGTLASKYEGGLWALQTVPVRFHPLIRAAIDCYRYCIDEDRLSKYDLAEFIPYMRNAISANMI